jgi:hypothetical protein
MSGKYMYIVAENVSVIGGEYGGFDACDTKYPEDVIQIWQTYPGGQASSYVTIDGVKIHDITDHNNLCSGTPGAGRHVDCMQVLAGHYITVRNSQFYNCATSDILMRPYKDTLDNITIENNFFQRVMNPGNVVLIGDSSDTVGGTNVIRYNYLAGVGTAARYTGSLQVYGNIIENNYACQNGTWSYNVFMGSSVNCGTNYVHGNPSFVGPTPSPSYLNGIIPNYRLNADDTVAKDRGDPTRYLSTDIDGKNRYTGSAADAGAYEIGAGVAESPQVPNNLRISVP